MLDISILDDEELQDCVTNFISALLPHENYSSEMFVPVLEAVNQYVHRDEMDLEYKIMFNLFSEMQKLRARFLDKYTPWLDRDSFYNYLERGTLQFIHSEGDRLKRWLNQHGMDSNMDNPMVLEQTFQMICERALNLYDTAFERAVSTQEVMNRIPELESAFLKHCVENCLNNQRELVLGQIKVGRNKYAGVSDWMKYTQQSITDLSERLSATKEGNVAVDLNKIQEYLNELDAFAEPIAEYGIDIIDKDTPMLRHRMTVVVGKENVGKTKFAINAAVNCLLEGRKVVFMSGELTQAKVFVMIMQNYIWKRSALLNMANGKFGGVGFKVRPVDIIHGHQDPDIQEVIDICLNEVAVTRNLIIQGAFDYGQVYNQLQALYEAEKFDAVFIDHSCALVGKAGDGSERANVTALSTAVKNFRKDYPVYCMVTSHPSSDAKQTENKGKNINTSPTRGSQALSTDADDVFVLRAPINDTLNATLHLENTKRRDADRIQGFITLRKVFDVSGFNYRPEDNTNPEETQKDSAISDLAAMIDSLNPDSNS